MASNGSNGPCVCIMSQGGDGIEWGRICLKKGSSFSLVSVAPEATILCLKVLM
jgi:hypothetical protein